MKLKFIRESDRLISKLILEGKTYPFYKSTGHNSGYRETWFPFHGILPEKGWFIKPHDPMNDSFAIPCFGSSLINYLNSDTKIDKNQYPVTIAG